MSGPSSGIGRAAVSAFAREGASVVVGGVSGRGNQETAGPTESKAGARSPSGAT